MKSQIRACGRRSSPPMFGGEERPRLTLRPSNRGSGGSRSLACCRRERAFRHYEYESQSASSKQATTAHRVLSGTAWPYRVAESGSHIAALATSNVLPRMVRVRLERGEVRAAAGEPAALAAQVVTARCPRAELSSRSVLTTCSVVMKLNSFRPTVNSAIQQPFAPGGEGGRRPGISSTSIGTRRIAERPSYPTVTRPLAPNVPHSAPFAGKVIRLTRLALSLRSLISTYSCWSSGVSANYANGCRSVPAHSAYRLGIDGRDRMRQIPIAGTDEGPLPFETDDGAAASGRTPQ
jgi:hypothetical protein